MLIPTELRRKLELEKQPVWLDFYNGRINVFGKKIYDERMQRAMVNLGDKVKTLREEGIQVAAMYARSGHARRVPGVSGDDAGRACIWTRPRAWAGIRGRSRDGWAGLVDRLRSGCGESGAGAEQHGRVFAERIHFHKASFPGLGEVLAAEGFTTGRKSWIAGGFGGLAVSVDGRREGVLADGRRAAGHADGPQPEANTAADIVNYESEKELADLIYKLGEERRSRKIARAIVRARPVQTTGQLAKLIEQVVPRTGKLHPATQTFMALRIAVNREEEELDALLGAIPRLVKPGGTSGDLTFMSLEDRR